MNLFNQILKQNQVDLTECRWCEDSWTHDDTTGLSLLPHTERFLTKQITNLNDYQKKEGRKEASKQTNQSTSEKVFERLTSRHTEVCTGVRVHAWCMHVRTCTYVPYVQQLYCSYGLTQFCLERCSFCSQGVRMKIFKEVDVLLVCGWPASSALTTPSVSHPLSGTA